MLNTLAARISLDYTITNTLNSKNMKKFNFFIIFVLLFFTASSVITAQVPGHGLAFDGVDDYVNVSTTSRDELNPEENLTLETWVYLDSATASAHQPFFIARLNSFSLTLTASGSVRMFIRTDEGSWYTVDGNTTVVPGRWYHLAGTYDGANGRV